MMPSSVICVLEKCSLGPLIYFRDFHTAFPPLSFSNICILEEVTFSLRAVSRLEGRVGWFFKSHILEE